MPDTERIPPSSDTELARVLHLTGRLSLAELQPALERIRGERAENPQASLGALLVGAGLLTAQEVEALQRPAPAAAAPLGAGGAPGQLAGFELKEELGRGSMGRVHPAIQASTGREVALRGARPARRGLGALPLGRPRPEAHRRVGEAPQADRGPLT